MNEIPVALINKALKSLSPALACGGWDEHNDKMTAHSLKQISPLYSLQFLVDPHSSPVGEEPLPLLSR